MTAFEIGMELEKNPELLAFFKAVKKLDPESIVEVIAVAKKVCTHEH